MHESLNEIISRLGEIAAERTEAADPGHDILHVRRVAANARYIAELEGADIEIVVAAALLHELFNYPKDHPDSSRSGEACAEHARLVLDEVVIEQEKISAITYAIRVHPFSLGIVPVTLEAKILQDADRLDALGAIGIARVFSTGSKMERPFYSELDPFCSERSPNDKEFTLDHFYRKLLKLPATMHTSTGRQLAIERVAFLQDFLDRLRSEIRLDTGNPESVE